MRKFFIFFISFALFLNFLVTQAEEQIEEKYYITFIFKEGKIAIEKIKDPLYGERECFLKLENPVIYREGKWYLPLEFFTEYFGGRFVTVNEKKFLIIFQEGTVYEEVIEGEFVGRDIVIKSPLYSNKVITGFIYINKEPEIYISEEVFHLFFGIIPRKENGKIAITLDLEF